MIGVRSLRSIYSESILYCGNKVGNLSKILSCLPDENCVLSGFCVTFDMHQDISKQMQDYDSEIRRFYRKLIEGNNSATVIVRSSADREDSSEALFPGMFKSFTSISTISELISSIRECVYSAMTPVVKEYSELRGVEYQFDYFTVLIQIELKSEYAGIAFTRFPQSYYNDTMIIQMTHGDNHNLTKGIGNSNTYSLFCSHTQIIYRCLDSMFIVEKELEQSVFEILFRLIQRIKDIFQDYLDVEWGYAGGKIYIFQVRTIKADIFPSSKDRLVTAFTKDSDQGLKFQSMTFFVENKLFQNEVLLFKKETPYDVIQTSILDRMEKVPLTVRFSCRHDIGLPRVFASTPEEAVLKIKELKKDDWSVIAYRCLDVKESFELYLDQEKTVLEYVPGIWESDSHLMSDVAVVTKSHLYFWLVKDDRLAKYEDSLHEWREQVRPTNLTDAHERFTDFLPIIQKLRVLFKKDFPINFHFVTDGEKSFFLNCRLSEKINWTFHDDKNFFIVRNVSDLAKWNRQSPILFSPNLSRGEEANIMAFIPFLKNVGVPIFVEFGLLSHPAIMLREFGISVFPLFNRHSLHVISNNCILSGGKNEF